MTGRVAVHTALTPADRQKLERAGGGVIVAPRVRYPLLAYRVQRLLNGRGYAGPYLGGHLHTLIRHNLAIAPAKELARASLQAEGGVILVSHEQMLAYEDVAYGLEHAAGR